MKPTKNWWFYYLNKIHYGGGPFITREFYCEETGLGHFIRSRGLGDILDCLADCRFS